MLRFIPDEEILVIFLFENSFSLSDFLGQLLGFYQRDFLLILRDENVTDV